MSIEVTVDNFDDLFPSIISDLRECDFIALDCEFTGLVADARLEPSLFDDIPQRYNKCRLSASKFRICQIGLTAFTKIPSLYKNQFSSVSYCFYLSDNSFDFNKWIKLGIPYLNASEASYLREALSSDVLFAKWIPDIEYCQDFSKLQVAIECLLAGENGHNFIQSGDTQYKTKLKRSVNVFSDLILLRLLKSKFADCSFQFDCDYLLINLKQDDSANDDIKDLNEMIFNYMKGFTRLFESLVEMKKHIVGHNCFMDLLFIYQSFIDPLPKSHLKFKKTIIKAFPVVYDTKTILYRVTRDYPEIRALIGNAKSLYDYYQVLTSARYRDNFFHDPITQSKSGGVVEIAHNASFDSYATGCVLIKLVHSIIGHKLRSSAYSPPTWQMYTQSIPVVNRVNIIRGSVNSLNLEGEDEATSRPRWLYIRRVVTSQSINSPDLELNELLLLLGKVAKVDVVPLSADEFLVACSSISVVQDVVNELKSTGSYSVAFYSVWKHHWLLRKTILLSIVGSACVAVWGLGHVLR